MEDTLIAIKRQRVLFYWNELSRHKVDIDASLDFLSYVFSVKRSWIIRIVKSQHHRECIRLKHRDLDCRMIDGFVEKLYKQAKKEREAKLVVAG